MSEHSAEKDAVLAVLREHWPESGGQSGHRAALSAQDACADAILRVFPPAKTTAPEREDGLDGDELSVCSHCGGVGHTIGAHF